MFTKFKVCGTVFLTGLVTSWEKPLGHQADVYNSHLICHYVGRVSELISTQPRRFLQGIQFPPHALMKIDFHKNPLIRM